jgi:hypothetical protein
LDWKDLTHQVGFVTNLQALETVLRYFLMKLHKQEAPFPNVGDVDTAVTHLTSFFSLNKLIDDFNAVLGETERAFEVDKEVIRIRDAFAHGRLLTPKEEFPARLWKFGQPKKGRVKIEFCEELTVEWLKRTSDMIYDQKQKVINCFDARGYQRLQ